MLRKLNTKKAIMSILLKTISFIIVLLGLNLPVHSDHFQQQNRFSHRTKPFFKHGHFPRHRHSSRHRHFPKPKPFPQYSHFPTCNPYTHSSVCHTYSGNTCTTFVRSYHPSWFFTCLQNGFIHACINLPTFPVPIVQNVCYPIGSSCTCVLGLSNGYTRYDPGMIL